jgi:hypothetical protein
MLRSAWRCLSIRQAVVVPFVVAGLFPATAVAQTEQSRWGVNVSGTPQWSLMDSLQELMFEAEGDIEGSEFTIGFVRGSHRGGDWGVSFVRKPFRDDSGGVDRDELCYSEANPPRCFTEITNFATRDVYFNGVEFHWFKPVATIKDRVQLGFVVGGGIAKGTGSVIETTDTVDLVGFNPQTRQPIFASRHTVEVLDVSEELPQVFPLAKAEVAGAVLVAPGLKLKVAGGLNLPGYAVRIGASYLFGAR